jgi:ferrous iron transport protein A
MTVCQLTFQNPKGIIHALKGPDELVARLHELGLHPGLEVIFKGRAPFSGPLLLQLETTLFALREDEAACVEIL